MAQALLPRPETDAAELLELYRRDLSRFAYDGLVIRTKSAALQPLVFNRAQSIVHEKFSHQMRTQGNVRGLVLKARQEGISTYTAARFQRRVSLYPQQNALVIADQRKRGSELFGIYELFDRKMPEWMRPDKRQSRRGWSLAYDTPDGRGLNSKLTVETAKDAAAGRGSTIQALHASEHAFWENPEEVWTSLMQAVPDVGSEVIIESTANGVGNLFHRMWVDAEAGESNFLPIFLPWWIHEEYARVLSGSEREDLAANLTEPEQAMLDEGFDYEGAVHHITLEQLAWRRATIRDKLNNEEALFRQEYPATAREAFLVSGNCFFDEEKLTAYEQKVLRPERFMVSMQGTAAIRAPRDRGELRMWSPMETDGEYVIFADTATGKMSSPREAIYTSDREQGGRDFSAAYVYDIRTMIYVALLHGRIPPEIFADKLYALGFLYSHANRRTGNRIPALLGVERNHSSGETVVRRLKDDLNYPNLFMDRQLNQRRNKMVPAYGWVTTEAKRTIMLDEFSAEVRAETIQIPDADLIRECFTFIRGENGKAEAQEGCHDDRVIAAAGCLQMSRHHRTPALPSARRAIRRGGAVGHIEQEEDPYDRNQSHR